MYLYSFKFYLFMFFHLKFWGLGRQSVDKSLYCSSRGLFSFLHPHQKAHNCLQFQIQRVECS